MPERHGFTPAEWLAQCFTCGRTYLASLLIMDGEFPGGRVCRQCWDPKHPQELIRPVIDEQPPSWTQPNPPYIFIATPATEDKFSMGSYMAAGQLMG